MHSAMLEAQVEALGAQLTQSSQEVNRLQAELHRFVTANEE